MPCIPHLYKNIISDICRILFKKYWVENCQLLKPDALRLNDMARVSTVRCENCPKTNKMQLLLNSLFGLFFCILFNEKWQHNELNCLKLLQFQILWFALSWCLRNWVADCNLQRTNIMKMGVLPFRRIPFRRIPFRRIPLRRIPFRRIPFRRIPLRRIRRNGIRRNGIRRNGIRRNGTEPKNRYRPFTDSLFDSYFNAGKWTRWYIQIVSLIQRRSKTLIHLWFVFYPKKKCKQ